MSNLDLAAEAVIEIIKNHCRKTGASLWDIIVNENPKVTIPQILKESGVKIRKDGSANISDLLNISYACTDKTKRAVGTSLDQLISILSSH